MAQPEQNTDYYATTKESETDSTSGGIWIADGNNQVTTREDYKVIDLGGLKVENAGNETYSCTYTITLAKETGEENADELIDLLNSGDMILNISDIDEASNYDLSNLKSSNGTKTFTAAFELTKDSNSKTFDATLHLVNKQGTNQSAFAGKKLNVKFTTSAECNIKKAETE